MKKVFTLLLVSLLFFLSSFTNLVGDDVSLTKNSNMIVLETLTSEPMIVSFYNLDRSVNLKFTSSSKFKQSFVFKSGVYKLLVTKNHKTTTKEVKL